ncbi:5152_t:CDS:1 [Entrophospora sp. SA101]|nr:5152_t:CDS:1 [Entrophospora sp. SA101]
MSAVVAPILNFGFGSSLLLFPAQVQLEEVGRKKIALSPQSKLRSLMTETKNSELPSPLSLILNSSVTSFIKFPHPSIISIEWRSDEGSPPKNLPVNFIDPCSFCEPVIKPLSSLSNSALATEHEQTLSSLRFNNKLLVHILVEETAALRIAIMKNKA